MSRGVWKAVETRTRKIGVAKIKERREESKKKERKKKRMIEVKRLVEEWEI